VTGAKKVGSRGGGALSNFDFFSRLWERRSRRQRPFMVWTSREELGVTVRYRMSLVADLRRHHNDASKHMRALLDACRLRDPDCAVICMRDFAVEFRQIGLTRSVFLYPYLRWALEKDRTASLQFESAHGDLMRSTLLIEAILTDYLGTPWDNDRRRRFVHVVTRLASLFSHGVNLETRVLLPLYVPPGQYRYVTDERGQHAAMKEEFDLA
jgi:hypothetical protein